MQPLNPAQRNRALGAMLGAVVGDAVGAPYEFSTVSPGVALKGVVSDLPGGGRLNWAPGEWTDDTAMAVPLLRELAAGRDLADEATLDAVVAAWWDWARDAKDVGTQTKQVLASAAPFATVAPTAAHARAAAAALHAQTQRTGGNGSLMRTVPVTIGYLAADDGEARTIAAARAVSELTHVDPDAGDACVIWCMAQRRGILRGKVDINDGIEALPEARRDRWRALTAEAIGARPDAFPKNGWVVHAYQAAVASLAVGGVLADDESGGGAGRYVRTIEAAINAAGDTDTVACIAGGMAGAEMGASVLPFAWLQALHGWPELRSNDLAALVARACAPR